MEEKKHIVHNTRHEQNTREKRCSTTPTALILRCLYQNDYLQNLQYPVQEIIRSKVGTNKQVRSFTEKTEVL